MQYIEAIQEEVTQHPSVFLAGVITNCPDWQVCIAQGLQDLDITIFNPRRKNFPIDDPLASRAQIEWEYKKLREADIVSFWFSEGSINPITLFEYGAALEREYAPVIVGTHPLYARRSDVEIQTALQRPMMLVRSSVDELIHEIRNEFEKIKHVE